MIELLDKVVIKELSDIQTLLFIGNSVFDNAVYQLSTKFVMPRTTEIVHHRLAHEFPVLADVITDYADDRGVYLDRKNVPAQTKEYKDTREIFYDLLEYMRNLEKLVYSAAVVCNNIGDGTTKVFLDGFLRGLIPYTKMTLALVDYVDMNGCTPKDNMDMDARINKYMEIRPEFMADND